MLIVSGRKPGCSSFQRFPASPDFHPLLQHKQTAALMQPHTPAMDDVA
jgi:hypothetical protein